jgi:hypothetical protein
MGQGVDQTSNAGFESVQRGCLLGVWSMYNIKRLAELPA